MEIDNAMTLRLLHFDKDQRAVDRKLLAYEICKMAFGDGENDGSDPNDQISYE